MTSGPAPAAVAVLPGAPAPEAVFERIAHLPYALWLDTAAPGGTRGWSFVAADPFGVLQARGGHATWLTDGGVESLPGPPLGTVAELLGRYATDAASPTPFGGGAAGFIGYEAARTLERLPPAPPADSGLPDLHLAFYDVVAGWNHRSGECLVVSTGRPERGARRHGLARDRLAAAVEWVSGASVPAPRLGGDDPGGTSPLSTRIPRRRVEGLPWLASTASRAEYEESVGRVIRRIRAGEVYQVNLSQRFCARTEATPFGLHRALRTASPAPYAAVVRVGDATVLSSSPERFLRLDRGGRVETRPIKGTRPRGADEAADAALAAELLASPKDRAENLMIVDLLRNDLSRVCRPGSVHVPALFRLESWATVHHLVSVVRGRLRDGVGPAELLAATFPSGSVTGAPKIRAMEMISELERVARGPYCGAIGYFAFDGRIDLSVAIRIVVLERGRATFHAGGGIVHDSDPAEEYLETLAKARGITSALAAVGRADVPIAPTATAPDARTTAGHVAEERR